jgi:serine/threonine-protein kinase RsbW
VTHPPIAPDDHVELRVPASSAYLAVLRTATAGLAARLDFTLDDIEDLRIAVDEACALLLPLAAPGARIECRFDLRPDQFQVAVSVPSAPVDPPPRDTFAWTVLTALAGEVDASVNNGQVTVTLRKQRNASTG